MNPTLKTIWAGLGLSCLLSCLAPGGEAAAPAAESAETILKSAGISGGLIVHVGCGDGKLTAALRADGRFLVHGLDADSKNIEAARRHIQSLKLYGPVAVEQWQGARLPYTDNLVNLIVVSGDTTVERDELLRVLAPNGVAVSITPHSALRIPHLKKPRPADIGEWTHFLHDAGGNPVARDRVVGPPRHVQWTDDPVNARSHEHTPSLAALVSSAGRTRLLPAGHGWRARVAFPRRAGR